MLEKPKFVPMARPYAFLIPIFLFICKLRLRKFCGAPGPDKTNERDEADMHRNEASADFRNRTLSRARVQTVGS